MIHVRGRMVTCVEGDGEADVYVAYHDAAAEAGLDYTKAPYTVGYAAMMMPIVAQREVDLTATLAAVGITPTTS